VQVAGRGLVRLVATAPAVTNPVNIGNPIEFTIMELAMQVINLVGSRSRIVDRALPENDPKQRQSDISRAQELLEWQPRIALKDGQIGTIAYFEELLSDQDLRAQVTKEASAPA
jgi:UDP-glucuronate decarboxylase